LTNILAFRICAVSTILVICVAWSGAEAAEEPNVASGIATLSNSSSFPQIDDVAKALGITLEKRPASSTAPEYMAGYPVSTNRWGITWIMTSGWSIKISFDGSYCVTPNDIAKASHVKFLPRTYPGVDGGPFQEYLVANLNQSRFLSLPFVPETGCIGYLTLNEQRPRVASSP